MHRYGFVICWSNEDEAFIADVPELPGFTTHGSSQRELLDNAQEAIELWLDAAREFSDQVPEPKGRGLNMPDSSSVWENRLRFAISSQFPYISCRNT